MEPDGSDQHRHRPLQYLHRTGGVRALTGPDSEGVQIAPARFEDPALVAFLSDHLREIAPTAPAESQHALDLAGLQDPSVRLWVAWLDRVLVGTVALARLADGAVELKSMRTAPAARGRGVATALLAYALTEARRAGAGRILLETGSMAFFEPARALYRRHGFVDCPPFGDYEPDPNSVFMTRTLG